MRTLCYKDTLNTIALCLYRLCVPLDIIYVIQGMVYTNTRMFEVARQSSVAPFSGTSKSAIKRRAMRENRCYKCGKDYHKNKCRSNTTSQQEFVEYFKEGPTRFNTEKARTNSMIILYHERQLERMEYYMNKRPST
nr:RNA binding protein [Nerine latent virus]